MLCEIVGKTDIGRQRFRNEDNFIVLGNFSLTVVADGMGGHVDGDVASSTAVNTIKSAYENEYANAIKDIGNDPQELLKKQESFLVETIQRANHNIFEKNRGAFSLEGMGTTVVAVQITENHAILAWVGDSRIYCLREEKLAQLSRDHSLVGELVKNNIIAEQDLMFLQNKNIITRALGMSSTVNVDTTIYPLVKNDILLLCSDGLSDLVPNYKIQQLLLENFSDLNNATDALIQQANRAGGQDNISVALVKIFPTTNTEKITVQ